MDISLFHFAEPFWLWMMLAIPLAWLCFFFFFQEKAASHQLNKFIDNHLLPYLLINSSEKKRSHWKALLLWTIAWSCLTIALAGPRWTFRDIETYSKDQSLVILLDLSESMNATDVKPSRLLRAKQKIEDILNASKAVKIGLIAFAADPHMITPLTEDKDTIRHFLPSLQTDLVYAQGSRLSSAIEMALMLLNSEPGNNKSLLVMSDGGFEDASAITAIKQLVEKGITIHTMGIGTPEGAPLKDREGKTIKKNGTPLLSKLEKETLLEISRIGKGHYLEAFYSNHDEDLIFRELEERAEITMEKGKLNRLWDEHFYIMIFPAIPIILWWFKKGSLFVLLFFILTTPLTNLEARQFKDFFKNTEQLGEEALLQEDYQTAANTFQDYYRQGVAHYKAGNFEDAENMFKKSAREEVASSATYNLGNALVQQQKFKEAIAAYENVLDKWPDHTKAKENLELVKKMVEQQQQQDPPPQDQDNNNDHQDPSSKSQDQDNHGDSKDQNDSNSQDSTQKQDDDNRQDLENNNSQDEQKNKQSKPQKQDEHPFDDAKSQEKQDADAWLNQIASDPKEFMQNKFYIESKKNGTKESIDPW